MALLSKQHRGAVRLIVAVARYVAFFCCLLPAVVNAQSDDDIDAIRQQIAENHDFQKIGAGYGAVVSFAVNPDVTTAKFLPDATPGIIDPSVAVFRAPYRHLFNKDSDGSRPFIQGVIAYQTVEAGLEVAENELIDARWRTLGIAGSGGMEIPLGDHLVVLPAVTVGYGHIDNDASYTGAIAESVLQPAFEGLVFDWDADVLIYGLTIGADYQRQVRNFELELHGSLTHHLVESFDSSSPLVDFETDITALDLEANTVHPTSAKLAGYPISVVTLFGYTAFFGAERDALAFSTFFEAGLALDFDIAAKGWKMQSFRVGGKAIFGPDVKGWGFIFGYDF